MVPGVPWPNGPDVVRPLLGELDEGDLGALSATRAETTVEISVVPPGGRRPEADRFHASSPARSPSRRNRSAPLRLTASPGVATPPHRVPEPPTPSPTRGRDSWGWGSSGATAPPAPVGVPCTTPGFGGCTGRSRDPIRAPSPQGQKRSCPAEPSSPWKDVRRLDLLVAIRIGLLAFPGASHSSGRALSGSSMSTRSMSRPVAPLMVDQTNSTKALPLEARVDGTSSRRVGGGSRGAPVAKLATPAKSRPLGPRAVARKSGPVSALRIRA